MEAESKFKKGRELVKAKDFEAALECYLFAYDNSSYVDGWGGIRLSKIPDEIAKLGKQFPKAIAALKQRRDAREKLIRAGETEFSIVLEWLSLNDHINEKNRELALLQELEDSGILQESVKHQIIRSNFRRLLQEKKYEQLSEYFDDLGQMFLFKIFHYEMDVLFPVKGKKCRDYDQSRLRIQVAGTQIYELALALGREIQADEIAKRILLCCPEAETHAMLINAAVRCDRRVKAQELTKQAKSQLPKEEFQKLKQIKRGKGAKPSNP